MVKCETCIYFRPEYLGVNRGYGKLKCHHPENFQAKKDKNGYTRYWFRKNPNKNKDCMLHERKK